MRIISILLVTLLFINNESKAGMTGSQLLKICQEYNSYLVRSQLQSTDSGRVNPEDVVRCSSYIQGVLDQNEFLAGFASGYKTPLCFYNQNVTTEQLFSEVYVYLKDNPDKLDLPAAVLIPDALMENYSCSKELSTEQSVQKQK